MNSARNSKSGGSKVARAIFIADGMMDGCFVLFLIFNAITELPIDSYYVRMLSLMNISVLLVGLNFSHVLAGCHLCCWNHPLVCHDGC
ncbi:hypothetical protein Nepgr_002626 [Nepenthes gracilis]|uniref:Uncharacterized protein n=1 Tax=Nepenthes gracilis TaxID=150966 RepID=A0AAD3PA67_NEPGR|nr:hypothetical protein Nepgr_002626 [Nepenthes gracilis]